MHACMHAYKQALASLRKVKWQSSGRAWLVGGYTAQTDFYHRCIYWDAAGVSSDHGNPPGVFVILYD